MNQATPAVKTSLQLWHDMIATGDLSRLHEIVENDAVFRSPMAFKPYAGDMAVIMILTTVSKVFQEFRYERTFVSEDGLNLTLEFSAKVGDKSLKGVDLIRFNANGKIIEFEVMVRPMSALQALGGEMAARLAAFMPTSSSS
ncbi:MAG: nuclear transport factor 2 family protein [Burkholderiaceae bacterium]|nr:nuclear transport factor 2 family protein [Burkholderiaceae bacterium]